MDHPTQSRAWARIAAAPVALLVPLALGCAGVGAPPKPFQHAGFTIDLLDGRVTEHTDRGATGDYDVEVGLSSQALSWEPEDPDEGIAEASGRMWEAFRAILQGDPSLPQLSGAPSLVDGKVDGQASVSFVADLGLVDVHSTVWRCPQAGLRITLNTSGMSSSAKRKHEESLASVKCGANPVALVATPPVWRFTGPADQWTEHPTDGDAMMWEAGAGRASLHVDHQANLLGDPDVPHLCTATMGLVLAELESTWILDPAKPPWERKPNACGVDWSGRRRDDGLYTRARVTHMKCGEAAYLATCMVFDPESTVDALCEGKLVCAPP